MKNEKLTIVSSPPCSAVAKFGFAEASESGDPEILVLIDVPLSVDFR